MSCSAQEDVLVQFVVELQAAIGHDLVAREGGCRVGKFAEAAEGHRIQFRRHPDGSQLENRAADRAVGGMLEMAAFIADEGAVLDNAVAPEIQAYISVGIEIIIRRRSLELRAR